MNPAYALCYAVIYLCPNYHNEIVKCEKIAKVRPSTLKYNKGKKTSRKSKPTVFSGLQVRVDFAITRSFHCYLKGFYWLTERTFWHKPER